MIRQANSDVRLSAEELVLALNLCSAIYVVDELLYKLTKTTMYKQEVKSRANQLCRELKPYFDIVMKDLFKVAGSEMETIVENNLTLIHDVMTLHPEQWQYVAMAAEWAKKPEGLRFNQLKALCVAAQNDTK